MTAPARPWDLRLGRWQDVLADVEMVDAVITDPPYSARTHAGHDAIAGDGHGSVQRRGSLSYAFWSSADVDEFVGSWAPRCRGWFVALSDSDLCGAWRAAFERSGLTGFQPIPCVIRGMSVRLSGDGPSSWAIYANVARPKALHRWGTLPGAYSENRKKQSHVGGKPEWLMRALIRDYSKADDMICDPCAGSGTTLTSANTEGRRSVGAEMDPETYAKARKRLEAGYTPTFDFGEEVAR